LVAQEQQLARIMNEAAHGSTNESTHAELHGLPELTCVADLYRPLDAHFLTTFGELDPYGQRADETYWGAWSHEASQPAVWPDGGSARVFAYLKPFPGLAQLLTLLARKRCATILVGGGFPPKLVDEFRSPLLWFVDQPVNMRQACAECDFAILNATHGS